MINTRTKRCPYTRYNGCQSGSTGVMGRVTDITVNDLRAIETEIEFPQYRRDTERNLTTQ